MQLPKLRTLQRATWLKVHLYLALSVGFLFALMGLTGSLSMYRVELDELFNPQLVIEQAQGSYQSLDKIMAAVKAAHPTRYGAWTLEMPRSAHSMATVWYDKPTETFFELYAPLMVSVNPYTSEVVASRFWGQTATTGLLDWHTQLKLDRFGWNTVGLLGVLLLISCGTGLYLWWPGLKALPQTFKLRHQSGMMWLAFDFTSLNRSVQRTTPDGISLYRPIAQLSYHPRNPSWQLRYGAWRNRTKYYQHRHTKQSPYRLIRRVVCCPKRLSQSRTQTRHHACG